MSNRTFFSGPWRFRLLRKADASGVSGTGHVADGIEFRDGTCVLRWMTEHRSIAIYNSLVDLEKIHGHHGQTVVEWIDERPSRLMERAADDYQLDSFENCPFGSVGGLDARLDPQRPIWITEEDWPEYRRGYELAAELHLGADWKTCAFGWVPALVIASALESDDKDSTAMMCAVAAAGDAAGDAGEAVTLARRALDASERRVP